MIKEFCDECNRGEAKSHMCMISCDIKTFKYNKCAVTIKVSRCSNNKNLRYTHKILCGGCIGNYYKNLQDDDIKKIISLELLDLISGKAKRIAVCNALEEGNGK